MASAEGSFHCDSLKGCVTRSYLLPACIVGVLSDLSSLGLWKLVNNNEVTEFVH